MKLSVELFQKTIQHLKGESGSSRVEKRTAPRMGIRAKILLQDMHPSGVGKTIEVWTRDISRVGLGVMSSRQFRAGEHYLLTIPHETAPNQGKPPLALYCTVRTCQAVTDHSYVIGFSFEDMRSMQFPKSRPRAKCQLPVAQVPISPAPVSRTARAPVAVETAPSGEEERIRRAVLD